MIARLTTELDRLAIDSQHAAAPAHHGVGDIGHPDFRHILEPFTDPGQLLLHPLTVLLRHAEHGVLAFADRRGQILV